MSRRKVYLYKNDPSKKEYYKINLGDILVNKILFDTMVEKFGNKKTTAFIQGYLVNFEGGEITNFLKPNKLLNKEEIEQLVDKFVEDGDYLYFNSTREGDVDNFISNSLVTSEK